MGFYANLKIRDKLITGFSAVVFVALAIVIFGYLQINTLERADNILFKKGVKPVEHIGQIAADFQRLRVNIREVILANSQHRNIYYQERVVKFRKQIDTGVDKLEAALPDIESKRLFDLLVQERSNYTPHLNRILEFSKFGSHDRAIAYLNSDAIIIAEHAEVKAIENLQNYLVENAEKISGQNIESVTTTGRIMLTMAFVATLLAIIMTILITRSISNPLRLTLQAIRSQQEGSKEKARLALAIAGGDLEQEAIVTEPLIFDIDLFKKDEAGMLMKAIVEMSEVQYMLDQAFTGMTRSLRRNHDQETLHGRLRNGQNDLNVILRGDKSTAQLTEQTLAFLAGYLGASVGVFYLFDEASRELQIAASYALTEHERQAECIALGEGLAGQAALERRMISICNAPADYLKISSGLGESAAANVVALPLLFNDALFGLLEIGSFTIFSNNDFEFLNLVMEPIAIALSVNRSHKLVSDLLEQTQGQTEELQAQQEELQQTNEELEERAQTLEQQREQIRAKNRVAEETSRELQQKANELERASAYKSEFLANMSHELRTPLNSMMILSSLLKDNREGNLTDKQVEFAGIINGAGRDLLDLINDILDLSKIESGHLEFHYEDMLLSDICERVTPIFQPISGDKGITFSVTLEESLPKSLLTDSQRTEQILKNLLSNACKFTSHGGVLLRIYTPDAMENPLKTAAMAFAVTDTGIGVPAEKRDIIFNAFQQADGSTNRTYGGTGLGLSISRQLARSMGGEITITSAIGKGSTFILYLPLDASCNINQNSQADHSVIDATEVIAPLSPSPDLLPAPIPDDRENILDDSKSILIIEDDLTFAEVLADMVRKRGFYVLVAEDGESGIMIAERHQPSAIILDIMLPHIDGWGVMRSLKDNAKTRHIPVHFITCLEERQKAMGMGAVGYITKPVNNEQLDDVFGTLESSINKTIKRLLIVEDDPAQAQAMVALLEERSIIISVAECGGSAIKLLGQEQFDCIVLDLGLADMGAFELLGNLKDLNPERHIPVIIHTGRELTQGDEKRLHHYAESIIIKGAKSPERLLNEVTLFLHLVEKSLDPGKQLMIRSALDKEAMLEGKKILIVDDDMRNIFSLSSALTEKDMIIFEAENGREALAQLDENPGIDLVLMDIMMPKMNGYEAMRAIRLDTRFQKLPIIALTAKAMKGDREECLNAGASDYIPKPVDMGKLFSLLRVWLYSAPASTQAGLD